MSIATNLLSIAASKTDLAENLTTKGVTSADTEALAALVGKVLDVPTGYTGYAPPSDWINIDTITNGNINLLVSDGSLATYAFICSTSTGTYHVDWGDGTNADFASATKAEHTYAVGAGQACSRGYTTFKIVISPNTGNLTAFAVTSHSLATQTQYHDVLSCVIAATYLTTLANAFSLLTGILVYCYVLERVKLVGTFTVLLNASCMFSSCYSLQTADVSGMVAVTNASSMFNSCYSLQTADVSGMVAVTNASYMFSSCSSLQTADVSGMVAVTNANSMFSSCSSLQTTDVSGMVAVTNANNMFSSCLSLQTADVSGMVAVTDASSMFNTCLSLQTADVSGMVAVTNANSMFSSCRSLQTITATTFSRDAASVTFLMAFSICEQLTAINFPAAKMTVLTAKGVPGKLNKLATITMHASSTLNGTNPTMDLQYNTLSAAQLNAIFTALPTIAKTINITGCTGAATCTRTIATTKGWTVVG